MNGSKPADGSGRSLKWHWDSRLLRPLVRTHIKIKKKHNGNIISLMNRNYSWFLYKFNKESFSFLFYFSLPFYVYEGYNSSTRVNTIDAVSLENCSFLFFLLWIFYIIDNLTLDILSILLLLLWMLFHNFEIGCFSSCNLFFLCCIIINKENFLLLNKLKLKIHV